MNKHENYLNITKDCRNENVTFIDAIITDLLDFAVN